MKKFLSTTMLAALLPNTAVANDSPTAGAPAQQQTAPSAGAVSDQTAPLIRETSELVDVIAEIKREATGNWVAVIARPKPADPPYRLTLMPGTRLAELQRLVETNQDRSFAIRVSGQMYVFREKNYLLPTQVAIVAAAPPRNAPATRPESDEESQSQPQQSATQPDTPAQRVLRELDERAGPRVSSAAGGGEGGARSHHPSAHQSKVVREGIVITNRRGKLTRDGSGAWVFVFDADAHGQADPPMKILPCLLLERMEDYARRVGGHAPAILNGTVYLYGSQNYLLPTVFLIPQDRRNITP